MGIEITDTKVLDHGYVKFIEHWGSDARIVEAARMSTDKGFLGWPQDEKLLRHLWAGKRNAEVLPPTPKHSTPFEMAGMVIEVQAPIFVFREWHRHRTQSYNEMSARYIALPDIYYIPDLKRMKEAVQSKKNKQGSESGFSDDDARQFIFDLEDIYNSARDTYENFLKSNVAREVARLVIPVSQYSRMRASANLLNWLRFLSLRNHSHAQWEIRQYAKAVESLVVLLFPRTWDLFNEGRTWEEDNP